MKNLKLAGLVVGLHALALVLIFVNPGCSSTSKPAPVAADTAPQPEGPPAVALAGPAAAAGVAPAGPVVPAPDAAGGIRYNPTRPGTPVAVALEAPPVADVTPATTYVVVKGDSLSTIARHHHLTAAELRAANGLKSGATLRVGERLVIPAKAGAAAAATSASTPAAATPGTAAAAKPAEMTAAKAPADAVKHTVKAGETLGSIARHYGVRMGDLATANNISDPKRIRPGQELIVPAKSSGTKAGKSAKTKSAPAAGGATGAAPAAESAPAAAAPTGGTDLDAGLQPPTAAEVPVVKVDDGTNPPPKNP